MSESTCPACGSTATSTLYRVDAIPVQSCVLLDTEEAARDFPRADLSLAFCEDCGFAYNAIFEPGLVDYAAATEESQHFSGTFNRFAARLVDEIAANYDLGGRQTLEIGCGKGDFLAALAARTGTRALGVDPGYLPDRAVGHVDVRREYFAPEAIDIAPDFIVCRHTLEHIADVATFVDGVRSVANGSGTHLFFETPDARRVLAEGAFWDIYYEHCSYFTQGSHARLFRRAGFGVSALYLDFDNQYIMQYADGVADRPPLLAEDDLDTVRGLARAFPETVRRQRVYWSDFVLSRARDGLKVAVWGGGSKAVSFLSSNGLNGEVGRVVDINPHKQGKYLPGTGHRVEAPEDLAADPPDTVIAMNPAYRDEIAATLASLGLQAELVAL
ncbi:MAG: class I SAM-dependent methyltransferase [Acuticoccus sp.]